MTHKMTGRVSPTQEGYRREAGHLFLLLVEGIDCAMATYWQSGQGGPGPSEDEEDRMAHAQKRAKEIAREIYLGLTGEECPKEKK